MCDKSLLLAAEIFSGFGMSLEQYIPLRVQGLVAGVYIVSGINILLKERR